MAGFFSVRCDVCGNILRRNNYSWKLENGRKVTVCPTCNARFERQASKEAFQSGKIYADQSNSNGGCALGCLGIIVAAIVWGLAQRNTTNPTPTPTPSPIVANTPAQPKLAEVKTITTPSVLTFDQQVNQSKIKAVTKYPELGKEGSVFNLRSLGMLVAWKEHRDIRLNKSDWPERLADECATTH